MYCSLTGSTGPVLPNANGGHQRGGQRSPATLHEYLHDLRAQCPGLRGPWLVFTGQRRLQQPPPHRCGNHLCIHTSIASGGAIIASRVSSQTFKAPRNFCGLNSGSGPVTQRKHRRVFRSPPVINTTLQLLAALGRVLFWCARRGTYPAI